MKKIFYTLMVWASIHTSTKAQGAISLADGAACLGESPQTLTCGACALVGGRYVYTGYDDNVTDIALKFMTDRWVIQYGGVTYYQCIATTAPKPPGTGGSFTWTAVVPTTCPITLFSLAGAVVLPIELTQFTAHTEGSKNHLTWATASEVNNKAFDIERSTDGEKFESIGTVKAANKASSYQYMDNQPFSTSYYRLRQIDNDGTETYSKVVSVTQKGGKTLNVYPTLVSNGLLTVSLRGDEATEGGDFAIYNVFGQQVQSGKTTQRLDVSALAKGTYILKVGTEQAKFVKQ